MIAPNLSQPIPFDPTAVDGVVESVMSDKFVQNAREKVALVPTRDEKYMQSILDLPGMEGFRDDTNPERREVRAWMHPMNFFLRCQFDGNEMGFIAFAHKGDGIFEVHPAIAREFRGAPMLAAIQQAFDWVFLTTHAGDLSAFNPVSNEPARLVAKWSGMREVARAPWMNPVKGETCEVAHWAVSLDEWLTAAVTRFEQGADNAIREMFPRAVGLFVIICQMAGAGQPLKAKAIWNRRAAMMNLPLAEYYGNRGGGSIMSIGPAFFEFRAGMIVPLGGVQQPPANAVPAELPAPEVPDAPAT